MNEYNIDPLKDVLNNHMSVADQLRWYKKHYHELADIITDIYKRIYGDMPVANVCGGMQGLKLEYEYIMKYIDKKEETLFDKIFKKKGNRNGC